MVIVPLGCHAGWSSPALDRLRTGPVSPVSACTTVRWPPPERREACRPSETISFVGGHRRVRSFLLLAARVEDDRATSGFVRRLPGVHRSCGCGLSCGFVIVLLDQPSPCFQIGGRLVPYLRKLQERLTFFIRSRLRCGTKTFVHVPTIFDGRSHC